MNATCDALDFKTGSDSQDAWIGSTCPPGLPTGWTYYKRYGASEGWSFDNLPVNEAIAFDEVHPLSYPTQTYQSALDWARRVTVKVLVYVEWTCNTSSREVVRGLIEARNPLVIICQEMFIFGEDGAKTGEDVIDWYAGRMPMAWFAACYCVSDQSSKVDPPGFPGQNKYTRSFSFNPGTVMAYWASTIRRLADHGSYSALQWGFGYRHPTDTAGQKPRAMRAWDSVLTAAIFRG